MESSNMTTNNDTDIVESLESGWCEGLAREAWINHVTPAMRSTVSALSLANSSGIFICDRDACFRTALYGGLTVDPQQGIYTPANILDFKRCYGSVVRMLNASVDSTLTAVKPKRQRTTNNLACNQGVAGHLQPRGSKPEIFHRIRDTWLDCQAVPLAANYQSTAAMTLIPLDRLSVRTRRRDTRDPTDKR